MWSDIAGGTDNEVSALGRQAVVIRERQRCGARESRHAADSGAIHHLILAVVDRGLGGLGDEVARCERGRYRFVDVDDRSPELGMLECQRPSETPQHSLSGGGAIAFGDRLRVARQEVKSRR
ncbi:Uncharacterised protein [Mycobacteroides abscessus subsp. abscessus]|nr:Uncharacterised protein [Mycobacteroides abscessus subsp. abscessus]